ncbi:MAG: TIGR03545 family protein, partial [Spirochaetaceae bacterium]|nr:TIGR03545 family protein [Spirochaetaceae bacterium]
MSTKEPKQPKNAKPAKEPKQAKAPKPKKEKRPKKIKIPGLFKKKYAQKKYQKKILRKLYVPADKAFIEGLFVSETNPKNKKVFYQLDTAKVTEPIQGKRLKKIAKDIKKQKGRFNVAAILAAIVCVTALCLALTVFRNVIARIAITNALESAFGARAEIRDLDVDLIHTRFMLDGVAIANKNAPMKNLVEIGRFELFFNIGELTRGKVVAENVEVSGVTWNTDRSISGALPPKKQKQVDEKKADAKPNPAALAIQKKLSEVQSNVSIGSGFDAIKDQLDPVAYINREMDALLSPKVVENIRLTVPALTEKWMAQQETVQAQVQKAIADGNAVAAIRVDNIQSIEDARNVLRTVQSATETVKSSIALSQTIVNDINTDTQTVRQLASETEQALSADMKRLTGIADSIVSFNLDSGMDMLSGLFTTFAMNTLGVYYPYIEQGLALVDEMKSKAAEKESEKVETLKDKSSAVARLPGRNFNFGKRPVPTLYLKNIILSVLSEADGFAGSGVVTDITNNADLIDKPVTAQLDVAALGKTAALTGVIDTRSYTAEPVNVAFDVGGFPVSFSAGDVTGAPSVTGNLGAGGGVVVKSDGTIRIDSSVSVLGSQVQVARFEPAF